MPIISYKPVLAVFKPQVCPVCKKPLPFSIDPRSRYETVKVECSLCNRLIVFTKEEIEK